MPWEDSTRSPDDIRDFIERVPCLLVRRRGERHLGRRGAGRHGGDEDRHARERRGDRLLDRRPPRGPRHRDARLPPVHRRGLRGVRPAPRFAARGHHERAQPGRGRAARDDPRGRAAGGRAFARGLPRPGGVLASSSTSGRRRDRRSVRGGRLRSVRHARPRVHEGRVLRSGGLGRGGARRRSGRVPRRVGRARRSDGRRAGSRTWRRTCARSATRSACGRRRRGDRTGAGVRARRCTGRGSIRARARSRRSPSCDARGYPIALVSMCAPDTPERWRSLPLAPVGRGDRLLERDRAAQARSGDLPGGDRRGSAWRRRPACTAATAPTASSPAPPPWG